MTGADDELPRASLPTAFRAPPPPRLWTLALGFGLYLATVLGGTGVTLSLYAAARYGRDALSPAVFERVSHDLGGILLAGLVSSLAGVGVALGAATLSAESLTDRLRLGPGRRGVFVGAALTVALLGMGAASTSIARLLDVHHRGALPVIRAALRDPPPSMLALAVAIIGLGAGAGEELLFRGYLLTRLAERWRPWVANALVALLFAAMHMDPVHSSFAMLVGLALGWASLRARSVRPTIAAHVVNNTLSVLGASMDGADERLPVLPLLAGGSLAALCALALVWAITREE